MNHEDRFYARLGANIRKARERLWITQEELAERAFAAVAGIGNEH